MTFQEFVKNRPDLAQCPKCKKGFDSLNVETELETGDVIMTAHCHGEIHRERVTKTELLTLEKIKEENSKPPSRLKKRRIVTIDPEIYKFNKFRKLK